MCIISLSLHNNQRHTKVSKPKVVSHTVESLGLQRTVREPTSSAQPKSHKGIHEGVDWFLVSESLSLGGCQG